MSAAHTAASDLSSMLDAGGDTAEEHPHRARSLKRGDEAVKPGEVMLTCCPIVGRVQRMITMRSLLRRAQGSILFTMRWVFVSPF